MDMQQHLLYLTKEELKNNKLSKLRGVAAVWKDPVACISFYFDGEVSEEDIQEASDICTYIIAHFPQGELEENYLRWDYPKSLPENFLAYKKDGSTMA
jgi:hypothetical protein